MTYFRTSSPSYVHHFVKYITRYYVRFVRQPAVALSYQLNLV